MHPRTFALALLAAGLALIAATMTANVVLDPQLVFGTPLIRDDENANYRYHRVRQYQAGRERFDGLLFASSRGKAFEPNVLADKMGAHAVAKFDVPTGMMTDHLPALHYILRDKAARGETIKALLLLIDIDFFGKLPLTNVNIDSFLPPELSGDHPARFWWRYLTVFQFRMWRGIIAHRWRAGGLSGATNPAMPERQRVAVAGLSASALRIANPQVGAPDTIPGRGKLLVATRPQMATHLDMLKRFASLCRDNGIKLTVATTPMRADANSLYYPEDLRDVVERLSRVVPVWDFTAPDWLARNPDFWDDPSHFKPTVGLMMLERMFGNPAAAPAGFGVLQGALQGAGSAARPVSQTL